jgi:hypothetical protein
MPERPFCFLSRASIKAQLLSGGRGQFPLDQSGLVPRPRVHLLLSRGRGPERAVAHWVVPLWRGTWPPRRTGGGHGLCYDRAIARRRGATSPAASPLPVLGGAQATGVRSRCDRLSAVADGWSYSRRSTPAVIRRILTHLGLSVDLGEPTPGRARPSWRGARRHLLPGRILPPPAPPGAGSRVARPSISTASLSLSNWSRHANPHTASITAPCSSEDMSL